MNVQLASDPAVIVILESQLIHNLISAHRKLCRAEVSFDELLDKCLSFTLKRDLFL